MSELEKRVPGAALYSTASAPYLDKHRLLADLRRKVERGEIERVGPLVLVGRRWEAKYIRLREPRSKMPAYATAFAIGMGAVAGVGAMLWHARYVILAALAGLAALAVLVSLIGFVAARAQGCSCVIHGPRCKG